MKNVMYVSGLAANLISVGEAIEVASVLYEKNDDHEVEVEGKIEFVAPKVRGSTWSPGGQREIPIGVKEGSLSERTREAAAHAALGSVFNFS